MSKIFQLYVWFTIHILKYFYGFSKVPTKLFISQAFHETGNFSSQVFKENKNLFGMRHPKIRKNYSQGTKHNHAYYSSYFDSIRDYFIRQKVFSISNTSSVKTYVNETVNSNYAEDSGYAFKWLNIYNRIKSPKLFTLFVIVFFYPFSSI